MLHPDFISESITKFLVILFHIRLHTRFWKFFVSKIKYKLDIPRAKCVCMQHLKAWVPPLLNSRWILHHIQIQNYWVLFCFLKWRRKLSTPLSHLFTKFHASQIDLKYCLQSKKSRQYRLSLPYHDTTEAPSIACYQGKKFHRCVAGRRCRPCRRSKRHWKILNVNKIWNCWLDKERAVCVDCEMCLCL